MFRSYMLGLHCVHVSCLISAEADSKHGKFSKHYKIVIENSQLISPFLFISKAQSPTPYTYVCIATKCSTLILI